MYAYLLYIIVQLLLIIIFLILFVFISYFVVTFIREYIIASDKTTGYQLVRYNLIKDSYSRGPLVSVINSNFESFSERWFNEANNLEEGSFQEVRSISVGSSDSMDGLALSYMWPIDEILSNSRDFVSRSSFFALIGCDLRFDSFQKTDFVVKGLDNVNNRLFVMDREANLLISFQGEAIARRGYGKATASSDKITKDVAIAIESQPNGIARANAFSNSRSIPIVSVFPVAEYEPFLNFLLVNTMSWDSLYAFDFLFKKYFVCHFSLINNFIDFV